MESLNLDEANKVEMPEAGPRSLATHEGRVGSCFLANLRHHRTFLGSHVIHRFTETTNFAVLVDMQDGDFELQYSQ